MRFLLKLWVWYFATACIAVADKPMNVVVLLADDWRFDTLGVAGNEVVKTPNLDALAARGFRFTNARVTTSICGVSRASLMTGQWMSRHGNKAFQAFKTPWEETLSGVLRDEGYHVGHVGKWHCGAFPAKEFDFARSYNGRHWMKGKDGKEVHVTKQNELDALEFLKGRPKEQPFLLNLCFFAPHAEDGHPEQYLPQPESAEWYDGVEIPVPPLATKEALGNLPPFLQAAKNEGRNRFHWRFDEPAKYQRMMRNYYRLCSEVDAVCGRVIRELESQGVLDETIVVFSGDNGYFHGDRGLADKWYPYEESIRVPLIVHDPRIPADRRGGTNDDFVLNVDIAPSLLAGAGAKVPDGMQGRDFSVLYQKDGAEVSPKWREVFFYEHGTIRDKDFIPASEAVVARDFKYTWWPEFEYEELFDLRSDPLEQKNLAGEVGHAEVLEAQRTLLKRLREGAR
jgi:arylsulfatase A-like enzyme